MSLKSYFPTLIYEAPLMNNASALNKWLKELKKDTLKIYQSDKEGHEWSQKNYAQGYTSYSSFSQLHQMNTLFMELKEKIDAHVKKYCQGLGFDKKLTLEMQSCWVNIMPTGATHSLHLHPLSVISGTFYLDCPKDASVIKFEDPRLSKMMAAPPRKDAHSSASFVRYAPKTGHLILFESWLRHEVETNRSKNDRISISFNYS
jgi:uncharacterized protein (TIGR02466 family)